MLKKVSWFFTDENIKITKETEELGVAGDHDKVWIVLVFILVLIFFIWT